VICEGSNVVTSTSSLILSSSSDSKTEQSGSMEAFKMPMECVR